MIVKMTDLCLAIVAATGHVVVVVIRTVRCQGAEARRRSWRWRGWHWAGPGDPHLLTSSYKWTDDHWSFASPHLTAINPSSPHIWEHSTHDRIAADYLPFYLCFNCQSVAVTSLSWNLLAGGFTYSWAPCCCCLIPTVVCTFGWRHLSATLLKPNAHQELASVVPPPPFVLPLFAWWFLDPAMTVCLILPSSYSSTSTFHSEAFSTFGASRRSAIAIITFWPKVVSARFRQIKTVDFPFSITSTEKMSLVNLNLLAVWMNGGLSAPRAQLTDAEFTGSRGLVMDSAQPSAATLRRCLVFIHFIPF